MVEIYAARSAAFINTSQVLSPFSTENIRGEGESRVEAPSSNDSLSLTTQASSVSYFNTSPIVGPLGAFQQLSMGEEGAASASLIPRKLDEQTAEALSNQQLKAEYGRHWQISLDSESKQQKCLGRSIVLNNNKEQALHMNKLSSTLKQNGQKLGQQALAKIAAGLALWASGAALEAAGKAMLGCPFTKGVGLALISKGRSLKERGLQIHKYGQKLGINSKHLLASGLNLGVLAHKRLTHIQKSWQTLNKIYKQIKTVGDLAQSSMLCAEAVGRKRGLSLASVFGSTKPQSDLAIGTGASKLVSLRPKSSSWEGSSLAKGGSFILDNH